MDDIFCHAEPRISEMLVGADFSNITTCPRCKGTAIENYDEVVECGSVNAYWNLRCIECDHTEGDFRDFGGNDWETYPDADFEEVYAI
ncbi:hypothetical protein OIV19_21745 [Brucella sp. HL-2]|nr:hypothetical protein [Brucella sp. HL-2]MCV9910221.1 hypothetical protein [Brucella sp. HL-2]